LLTQRVGIATSTAAEYVQKNDKHLWEHMKKYSLKNIEEGIEGLK
jgi:glutamate receptor ionotropic, NMDA 3A